MAATAAGEAVHTTPHALLLPYPAQGHVIPFMELADRLIDRGFAVTFVNTEFNHRRVVAAAAAGAAAGAAGASGPTSASAGAARLRLVAVADGMDDGEDRDDFVRLNACMQEAIPPQLDALLDAAAAGDDDGGLGNVTCVVVDVLMSWMLDAAKRRGLSSAAVWATSAAALAVVIGAKDLIRDGVIDDDGAPLKLDNNTFRLADSMPAMDAVFLPWNYMGNRDAERIIFHYLTTTAWAAVTKADVLLCNTFEDLEPDIFGPHSPVATSILPIGPLRTWQRRTTSEAPVGHFWRADDEACVSFLDAQPHGSVAYVAFGSVTVMSPAQLQELALALLASGRPFLWVFRPGLAAELPSAFTDLLPRHGKGKVVEWAPQEKVLGHPAVGCFLTHCGWNSTLEGVRHGVPLLCWPYFTDQFTNQAYICDIWRVGLRVVPKDSDGIVTKDRIMERLESLMGDSGMKERVKILKGLAERSMGPGGQSLKNLNVFMESMRK